MKIYKESPEFDIVKISCIGGKPVLIEMQNLIFSVEYPGVIVAENNGAFERVQYNLSSFLLKEEYEKTILACEGISGAMAGGISSIGNAVSNWAKQKISNVQQFGQNVASDAKTASQVQDIMKKLTQHVQATQKFVQSGKAPYSNEYKKGNVLLFNKEPLTVTFNDPVTNKSMSLAIKLIGTVLDIQDNTNQNQQANDQHSNAAQVLSQPQPQQPQQPKQP